jgi:hypothetical protein
MVSEPRNQEKNPQGEPKPEAPQAQASTQQPVQAQVNVDDSTALACYANFCRVSSTPEELILDLGLNPQPMTPGNVTVKVSQRIILNHFTAKRLLSALSMALQRHEQAFGVLETDIRKRMRQT